LLSVGAVLVRFAGDEKRWTEAQWSKKTGVPAETVHRLWRSISHFADEQDDGSQIVNFDTKSLASLGQLLMVTAAGLPTCSGNVEKQVTVSKSGQPFSSFGLSLSTVPNSVGDWTGLRNAIWLPLLPAVGCPLICAIRAELAAFLAWFRCRACKLVPRDPQLLSSHPFAEDAKR